MLEINNVKKIAFIVFVAASSFFLYLSTLDIGFIWDDIRLVSHPLSLGDNKYSFLFGKGIYYRPALYLSMLMDYSFYNLNPKGYHLTNIILHAVNASLLFVLCYVLAKRSPLVSRKIFITNHNEILLFSFFAAIVFSCHPIHTESVAWISGRTDLLTTLFFQLAFISYLVYESEDSNVALALSCLFFLFSLFCKENGISFIAVILSYGLLTKMPTKRFIYSLAAIFCVIGLYLFLRQGIGIDKAQVSIAAASTESSIAPFVYGVGYYLEKLVFPINLNLMPQIPDNPIYVLIFTMPVIIGIILFYKGLKLELFLIFWIMLTLAPSLLTLYSQVISPIGERYLYLPSVGFSIIVGLALITTIHSRKVMTIVFIGMIIVYATLTYERLTVWENEEFLWHDTMKKSPNLGTPYANYGAMLLKRSQYAEARDIFLQSLTKQTTTQTKSIIFNLLGSAEMGLNNNTKAEEYLLKSLELSPDNIRTYNTLGVLYINLSENDNISDKESAYYLDKAITNFEKALKISPNFIQPIFHLGLCYFKRGEHKKAEGFFYSVLKLQQTGSLAEKSLYFLKLIQSTKLKQ